MTNRAPNEQLYKELKALIEMEDRHTELECREYLKYAVNLLFREPPLDPSTIETEYRGHSGDSDLIIVGGVRDETGIECIRAYVWELKAPQCFVFEKDSESRLKPTQDLVSAENQLLNYLWEHQGSGSFLSEFNVKPENVRFGGIIIGSSKTKVKNVAEDRIDRDYEKAITIRRKYFYDLSRIRLMIWDSILDHFQPETYQNRSYAKPGLSPIVPPHYSSDLAVESNKIDNDID